MDKLKALYESYIEQGLLSKETSFEQFSQSDSSIQEALYKQGVDEKIISSETTFDIFTSAWAEKKNPIVTPSDGEEVLTESTTETEVQDGASDSLEVNKVVEEGVINESELNFEDQSAPIIEEEVFIPDAPNREGVLDNKDGSISTHKMRTETDGQGNWFSFPTILQNEDGSFVDMSEKAEQDWESVYQEAKNRGEVIDFGTDKKSAIKFGEGSWKASYNANKKNKLLFDSGFLAYKELKEQDTKQIESLGISLESQAIEEGLDTPYPGYKRPEEEYGFVNPETGETNFKKASELSPDLLEAIETYSTATNDVDTPNYLNVELDEGEVGNVDVFLRNVIEKDGGDVTDFLKWEKKNTRNETAVYKWMKKLLPSDEGNQYLEEKNAFEKLQSYKAAKLNQTSKKLAKNQALLSLTSDPKVVKELNNEAKEIQKEFYGQVNSISNTIEDFPTLKEATEDTDLRRRKAMYEASQEGGLREGGQGLVELLSTTGNALAGFSMDVMAGIPAVIDQRLSTELGYDGKGFLKGLEEMFTDSAEVVEKSTGAVNRGAFLEGKPVMFKAKEYIVDENGTVYDSNTNIRMDGIISSENIKEIQTLSKDVTENVTNWTAGSVTQGGVGTLVNLFALIRTSGKVKGKLNLKGAKGAAIGMGLTSTVSGIAGNVEDVRSQLVASGMSEKESLEIAVNAGQAISTLDGVFSMLAGGNQKLLTGFTGIKDQIKNLAIKKGKNFTVKQLVDKGKGLAKENAKELFIEELPVYFAEKGINHLVNRHIGNDVLNDKITKAGIIETAVMTIGATSGLGARKLLTGNRRADLVRLTAANVNNLQSTLDVLVKEGSLTKKESSDAYTEIYNMQSAELKTQGTIKVSENLEPASDLLTQRQNLVNKKQGLEGPGKADIDKQIAAVDQQLDALYKKDELQVQEELTKQKEDAISKPSTEKQMLPDDAGSQEEGGDSKVELQQVGKGDPKQVTTDTQVGESDTKTDQVSDTTTQTDTEQLTDEGAIASLVEISKQEGGTATSIATEAFAESQGITKEEASAKIADLEAKGFVEIKEEGKGIFKTSSIKVNEGGVMSVNKERVDSIVDGIIKKTKDRNVKGEQTNPQKLADNAIEYLKGSKLFEQATDTERETILRDVSKKLGVEIKAPTAKKLLGIKRIGKPKTITVKSDYAGMKKDLQKEAKVARDAKNDVNKRRKGLQGAIDLVLKAGNITTKKANTLLKKVSNVNLYNAKKVQDVLDFTTRAMNDAEYSNKLDKAKKLQKSIKTKLKGKEAGLSDSAKKFTEVNPSNVSDIDTYLEKAESISKGLQPTRKPSKGSLKVSKPFDIKKTDEYSKKETDSEANRNYELAKESFQELTGLEPGDLTLDQMKDMMYEIDGKETSAEEDIETLKKKKVIIDKAVNNAFKNTKINIKGAIEAGDINLSRSQKILIKNFLNMDLSLMTTKQKMEALDSIVNFELNQSTGGMEAALMKQVGAVKLTRVKNKGVKSADNKSLFGLGKFWNKQISTLPNIFELTFKSQQKARMVMEALGLDGIINGSAKAQNESARVEKDYANTFAKKKMKDGIYFDESNDIERGILADVRRVTPGTESEQQKEFDDSKNLIKETYERLISSGDKLKVNKGEVIKAQYDNLLKDSNSISDVESKADPVNLDGVKYVTEIWAEKYNDLADTSLNVYNKNLGKDINYTPRNIQSIKETKADRDITQPVFNPEGITRKNAYDKKTGVLKEATKPSSLGEGKVLNLSFDAQNMSNYKAALTDIYTAPSIQQVKGARESKAFKEVFTNESSKEIINERINSYVDSKRGKKYVDGSTKRALNRLNKVATLGVSRVLGGPTQFLKQIVPIFNTGANAGVGNTLQGAKLIFDAEVQKAIDNSGLPIANRGISSQSDIENADSRIKKKAQTKSGRIIDAADQINKKTLEAFLVYPDVQTARASFIAYYIQQIKKDGGDTSNIDWSKPLDKKAAQYAQQQVDRQQNTSDQDLQGDLFTNQNFGSQMVRKTLFPFANFLLNQKTRMYSDINTLTNNPTALPGDKSRALRSLGGLGVETVMFNAIGLGITQTLAAAARLISGEEEDPNLNDFKNAEERSAKRDKEFKQRLTGRLGNMVADILVPIPILNDETLNQVNGLLNLFQGEEDPFQFFAKTDKKLLDQLGTLGIGPKKAVILADMIKTIITGEKTTVFMGKESTKKISPEKLNALRLTTMAYAMHAIGVPILNSSEVGYVSERAFKDIGKSKVIEEKYNIEDDAYDRLEERGLQNPSDKAVENEMKRIRREIKNE